VRPAPWEIWWTNFNPQIGTEQAGDRPAVIIGSQLACRIPNGLVLVVPVTNTNRGLPWQPAVAIGDKLSHAMCDQMKAVSIKRLRKRHEARLTAAEVDNIRFALAQLLDLG
jgi:mRNA interferase MazF